MTIGNGTQPKGALDGVRVLDLGRYQAGPRCGLMFARLGADVIKVEALTGDESRSNGPKVRGQSAYWVQYNSGKRSLSINLRTEEGKEVLRDLVKVSDVLIQNFRPGTIGKMGFGYEELKKLNKGIVMVNVSAYGQYGPFKDRVGFDTIGQAMSGLMSLTGPPEGDPTVLPFPLIDRITSLHATIGALGALYERQFSGEGQAIDVCLADTGFTTCEIPLTAFLGAGIVPERTGNGDGVTNSYKTKDGHVYLAGASSDNIFPRLADTIGHPEWKEDPRWQNRTGRSDNSGEIEAALIEWFSDRTMDEAEEILNAASIPCAPVNDIPRAAMSKHLKEREVLVEVPDPIAGTIHVTGKIVKFSRSDVPVGSTPTVGQHNEEIMRDLLGKSDEEIAALREADVIG
ncbi:MAG: CoA transferase [Chloroflexi bacterium]|nr:CoA transferase [Chloroflexota bacterium]MCH8816382.1 CoA transferase [Chloroflexota bacterium]